MADVHSEVTRSYNMSMIRSKDTKPEVLVRKYLFSLGLRYRKNDKRYAGCPDIVLPKYRTIVFINSCFWHKHIGCQYFVLPKSNTEFWDNKLEANRRRDERNIEQLYTDGWSVIVVWECELRKLMRNERLEQLYAEVIVNANLMCQSIAQKTAESAALYRDYKTLKDETTKVENIKRSVADILHSEEPKRTPQKSRGMDR